LHKITLVDFLSPVADVIPTVVVQERPVWMDALAFEIL